MISIMLFTPNSCQDLLARAAFCLLAHIAAPRSRAAGAELADERDALVDGNFEMGRPGNAVQLMQIIRHNPQIGQPFVEIDESFHAIVHPPQQNALAEHGYSRVDQLAQGRRHGIVDFCRMIDVNDQDSAKPTLRRRVASIIRFSIIAAAGYQNRQATMKISHPMNVGYIGDPIDDIFDHCVR